MCPGVRVCVCVCALTVGVQEGGVQLSGQQRIGHVSEELFEQGGHVVNAVVLVQLDVHPQVKILAQLRMHAGTRTDVQRKKTNARGSNRAHFSLIIKISPKQDAANHQL